MHGSLFWAVWEPAEAWQLRAGHACPNNACAKLLSARAHTIKSLFLFVALWVHAMCLKVIFPEQADRYEKPNALLAEWEEKPKIFLACSSILSARADVDAVYNSVEKQL